MLRSETEVTSFNLADGTFSQFESYIRQQPSLIFPVGGLEPVGSRLALGTVNTLCGAFAAELSKRCSVAVAPVLSYGATVPFKSFGGSAGVRQALLSNLVVECCKCWFFQGIKRIMILALSMDASNWGSAVVKRLSRAGGGMVRVVSLQDDQRFRGLCGRNSDDRATVRSEHGLTSLAAFLCPENIRSSSQVSKPVTTDGSGSFKQWFRRGRDPEQLRKHFPGASITGECTSPPDVAGGKTLYKATLQFLTDDMKPFFTAGDNATR